MKLVNGVPIELSAADLAQREADLVSHKKNLCDSKLKELQFLREKDQYADYDYNGIILKATESTQTKLGNISDIFNGLTEISWFDINDNPIVLDHAKIREIKVGLYQRAFALYAKEKTLAAELKAITDLATLEAFNVQARWDVV